MSRRDRLARRRADCEAFFPGHVVLAQGWTGTGVEGRWEWAREYLEVRQLAEVARRDSCPWGWGCRWWVGWVA